MKRFAAFGLVSACLASCGTAPLGTAGGSGGGGQREFLVLGGSMTFQECQARGGLIIRDANTSMVACDPRVIRTPSPSDAEEFGLNPVAAQG
ncbi:hypothetical protein AAD018_009590 [Aestuariibius insulae]|uniref:hypothetical protein n=1 Tax=Aestuariibius insulae TaxID=2058287 RepID=UPI00345E5F0B